MYEKGAGVATPGDAVDRPVAVTAAAELLALSEATIRTARHYYSLRRLLLRADEAGQRIPGLLYTSSRTFPRSRRNSGPLIDALDAWLQAPDVATRPVEDSLHPA